MLTILWLCLTLASSTDNYHETLHLTPLADGRIISTFEFTIDTSDATQNEYNLFPKSLGQILISNNVKTLSLVLTKGAWDRNMFGDLTPFPIGPPGAELRATFWNNSNSNSNSNSWIRLKAALGGLYCTSLSTIEDTTTIQGTQHVYPNQYHGILQREMLCTENLAPLIKLLPCRTKAGLATLLEPTVVFAGDFTAIGLRVTSNQIGQLSMSLTTTLILDNAKTLLQSSIVTTSSSLSSLATPQQQCPHASSSTIQVHKPAWGEIELATAASNNADTTIKISHTPDEIKCNGNCWIYNCLGKIYKSSTFCTSKSNLYIDHQRPKKWQAFILPGKMVTNPLDIRRSLTGTGRVKGGIATQITNIGTNIVNIQYLDIVPWYLQLYTHTFQVKLNGDIIANGAWRSTPPATSSAVPPFFQVTPTYNKGPPSTIESIFVLKPGDTLKIEIQYLVVFLQFEQFPPDANRGFDVPSAIIQVNTDGKTEEKDVQTIYTDGLMIEMPYPDFSMPYNVITLTSTLMAFIGGTILNMLSRKKKIDSTNST